jgi:hypothetical protein
MTGVLGTAHWLKCIFVSEKRSKTAESIQHGQKLPDTMLNRIQLQEQDVRVSYGSNMIADIMGILQINACLW